jgi:hypothetical protein
MSFRQSIRREGRNIQLVLAAIFIILTLSMGTVQTVSAFPSTETTWVPVFYRTGCGDLGNTIQARFEWDISGGTNNTNTMTIKEHGHYANKNNVSGAFKFVDFPIGEYSYGSPVVHQYPGIYAFANFVKYEQYSVNTTMTEPTAGLSSPTTTVSMSAPDSYTANMSIAKDEFEIIIAQTSTDIIAYFYTWSSTGSLLHSYNLDQSFSGVTHKPPYHEHYALTAELDGIDPGTGNPGYANLTSGTDFQIEGLISPSTITDFTQHLVDNFKGSSNNILSIPSCSLTSYPDEEGVNGLYTFENSSTTSSGNEAYQYYKVTPHP